MTATRIGGALGAAVVLAGAWGIVVPWSTAQEPDAQGAADGTWAHSCRSCHAVPDVRYETDRAFLRQITETS